MIYLLVARPQEVAHSRSIGEPFAVCKHSYPWFACAEEQYRDIVVDPQRFRAWLNQEFQRSPELFPEPFAQGFHLADRRLSKKLGWPVRRLQRRDGTRYSVRPSSVMPYMTAATADVDKPLLLRKFGVPFWALAYVFGRDPMFWFRVECQLGQASLVGTTARKAQLPQHLLADEHHQTRKGEKVYIATTVAVWEQRCGQATEFEHPKKRDGQKKVASHSRQ